MKSKPEQALERHALDAHRRDLRWSERTICRVWG